MVRAPGERVQTIRATLHHLASTRLYFARWAASAGGIQSPGPRVSGRNRRDRLVVLNPASRRFIGANAGDDGGGMRNEEEEGTIYLVPGEQ